MVARWRGRFPATHEASYIVRGEMAAIGRECGLSDEQLADVKLAVSEAVTNAVRHAYRNGDGGDITATADVEGGRLHIVIADHGSGMQPRADSPGLGLGLPLMAHLADAVDIVRTNPGTEIHMTFPCPATA